MVAAVLECRGAGANLTCYLEAMLRAVAVLAQPEVVAVVQPVVAVVGRLAMSEAVSVSVSVSVLVLVLVLVLVWC